MNSPPNSFYMEKAMSKIEAGEMHTRIWTDNETDLVYVTQTQDVEAILDNNRRLHNENKNKRAGEMQHVATIPNIIINKWLGEGINIFDPASSADVAKKLNDPEWQYLRTGGGRVGRK